MHPLATPAALTAVLALLLAGCSASEPGGSREPAATVLPLPDAPPATTATPAELERFYTQEVSWTGCRTDKECATIEVPLDYADPGAGTVELSLLRVPATGGGSEASLVVNPGGPGASGVDYAEAADAYFGADLRAAFDIVGFDPRGVGESTPVDCLTDAQLDEFIASDPDPDTDAEAAAALALLEEFGQGCLDRSGELAGHVSTVEAARDLDVVRAVLGQRRLVYFGASYGTLLGATYAELHPDRVGRMVLDGAIDPTLDPVEMSLVQAQGFETALRAYVAACTERADCFLGDTVDRGTARIREFLDAVDEQPLPGADGRDLEVGNAVLGIWTPLYNAQYWYLLDQALQSAFDGNGAPLLALSDAYVSRGGDGYQDNGVEALYAVNCLDAEDTLPTTRVQDLVPRFERASPTFGAIFAWGLISCERWPVEGVQLEGPIDAEGAPPILVVGTSRDPATPLVWAEALAAQLDSGVLVRRDGDGHTGYNAGNACVDDAVEDYLIRGQVPESDLDC